MRNKTLKLASTLLAGIVTLGLQGCSGHPGAGTWVSDDVQNEYRRLEVQFDGKSTLYPTDTNIKTLPCLWQAKSSTSIDIKCGDPSSNESRIVFELTPVGTDSLGESPHMKAVLMKDDKPVAYFTRQL